MENQPLLTVIVPCYNVEKYVDKCISSIVSQTYSNLEFFLIDDGSTDSTGKICDEWQERDSRIRVIHKQNEGLAYARKTGVEHSTAEYVTFVDSDDWIEADMYTNMMEALLTTDSDISQCGVRLVYEDGSVKHRDNENKAGIIEVFGRIEGTLLILEDTKWRSWMWCKIFKKYLFDNIRFLKGNGFAEDYISHQLFHKAQQSVYLHDEYYNYFQRTGSITKSKNIAAEMKNYIDYSDAHYERYLFIVQHPEYHSVLSSHKRFTIFLLITILHNIVALPQYFPKDFLKIKAEQLKSIPLPQKTSLKWRFYILLLKINPKCYQMFRLFYIRMISISNKLTKSNKKGYILLSEKFGF